MAGFFKILKIASSNGGHAEAANRFAVSIAIVVYRGGRVALKAAHNGIVLWWLYAPKGVASCQYVAGFLDSCAAHRRVCIADAGFSASE